MTALRNHSAIPYVIYRHIFGRKTKIASRREATAGATSTVRWDYACLGLAAEDTPMRPRISTEQVATSPIHQINSRNHRQPHIPMIIKLSTYIFTYLPTAAYRENCNQERGERILHVHIPQGTSCHHIHIEYIQSTSPSLNFNHN